MGIDSPAERARALCVLCAFCVEIFSVPGIEEKDFNTERTEDHREKQEEEHVMAGNLFNPAKKRFWRVAITVLACVAALWLSKTLSAQQQGPMKSPPGTAVPQSDPQPKAAPVAPPQAATPKSAPVAASTEPPPIPIDEIIRRFAAREAEFKTERDNFTYTQTFVIQTLDGGKVDGEYRMTSEIVFTPEGKRYEKVTNAPPP